jgi:hypothetical protein
MSIGDLIDDDPDVGAAMEKILAKGPEALGDRVAREDERENRTDREAHEQAEDADLDTRPEPVETKGKDGAEQAANEGDEQFLEIPGETEDAEPVKVPLSEAADAVKQLRQMNGDIATAVIRAETEAQEKSDKLIGGMQSAYDAIATQAKTVLQLMQQFLPTEPNEAMLDRNSEHYDPVRFYEQKAYFDRYVEHARSVHATIAQAEQGKAGVMTEAMKAEVDRENARLARFIPEFGKPETATAKKAEILSVLNSKYGITKEDLDGVHSHKAWRIMADLAKLSQVQTKAPEVRKAVQEKAAKITNGKLPPRDQGSGQFVSADRKALRETGSVEAAAQLFMRSGLTKGL